MAHESLSHLLPAEEDNANEKKGEAHARAPWAQDSIENKSSLHLSTHPPQLLTNCLLGDVDSSNIHPTTVPLVNQQMLPDVCLLGTAGTDGMFRLYEHCARFGSTCTRLYEHHPGDCSHWPSGGRAVTLFSGQLAVHVGHTHAPHSLCLRISWCY